MIIELNRAFSGNDSTIGVLSVNGEPFCFTVEDEGRESKVTGETRIPAGSYPITLRNEGGMTKRYAEKFPDMHQGMIWLRDVPGFTWVYIHIGNTDDHSEGCILVNYNAYLEGERGGRGGNSTKCYADLYAMIVKEMNMGNPVQIIVKDHL